MTEIKRELYWEGNRMMEKRTWPSGKIIIKDITIKEARPTRVSQRELLLRIAEKLGVPTE